MKKQTYYYILHLLAGITIGFMLFGCGLDSYKYRITGKIVVRNDTIDAIAYTNDYTATEDSVFYYNSTGSRTTLLSPYTIYENQSRK